MDPFDQQLWDILPGGPDWPNVDMADECFVDYSSWPDLGQLDIEEPASECTSGRSAIESGFQKTPRNPDPKWTTWCRDETHPQNSVYGNGSRGCVLGEIFQPRQPPPKFQQSLLKSKQVSNPPPSSQKHSLQCNLNFLDLDTIHHRSDGRLRPTLAGIDEGISQLPLGGSLSDMVGPLSAPSSRDSDTVAGSSSSGPDVHDHQEHQQQPTTAYPAEPRENPCVLHRGIRQTASGSHKKRPYDDGEEDEKLERKAACSVASGDREWVLSMYQVTYAEDPSNAHPKVRYCGPTCSDTEEEIDVVTIVVPPNRPINSTARNRRHRESSRPPKNATHHNQHRPERHITINSECHSLSACEHNLLQRNCTERKRRIHMKELFEALRLEIPSIQTRKASVNVILCEAIALCKHLSEESKVLRLQKKLLYNRLQQLKLN